MNLDNNLLMSAAQALATAASDNVLDLKDCGDDLSRRLNVFAKIDGGSVATGVSMQAVLETSENNADFVTLVTYPARTTAQMNADGWIVPPQPLPAGLKRYVRMSYTAVLNAGEDPFTGSGKIMSGLTASLDKAL